MKKPLLLTILLLAALAGTGCVSSEPTFVSTPEPRAVIVEPQESTPIITAVPAPAATATVTTEMKEISESSSKADMQNTAFFVSVSTTPAPTITSTPIPTATPEALPPENISESPVESAAPASITIGAVGDIMVMPSQLVAAKDPLSGKYDFSRSFQAVARMFQANDLMCGNLEGAIAGEGAGYSNGQTDSEGRIRFNAPDELASDLKAAGFRVITTANNHAGDCNKAGIISTITTLKKAGLHQTGTFESAEARKTPLVVDVNGFKIGIMASTTVINGTVKLAKADRDTLFSRMQYTDMLREEVLQCKEAGAEFIIMFAHWDKEYKSAPQKSTRKYAEQLLSIGIDCVIGAHPHVVQPFEMKTVTREDGTQYTGLIAYSLGNFLSNMTGDCNYELYLQLTLERNSDNAVVLKDAAYMPLLCYAEEVEQITESGKNKITIHQVIPCLSDISSIDAYNGISERKKAAIEKARAYVTKICGESVVPLMEDACWIN